MNFLNEPHTLTFLILQHFFGEIRQGCGAHSHPDPWQFIQIYRLMSFKSLVKPPRGSNVTGADMLQCLLDQSHPTDDENKQRRIQLEKEFDEALDTGEIINGPFSDHTYYENLTIDFGALRMFGGYVARKARKTSVARNCETCYCSLTAPVEQPLHEDDDIIHSRSLGYLLIPSDALMNILQEIETSVLQVFQSTHLHKDLIFESNFILTIIY